MVMAAKKVTSKNANGVLSTGKGSNGNDDVMTLSVIIKKVDAQLCDAKRAIFLCRSSVTLIFDIMIFISLLSKLIVFFSAPKQSFFLQKFPWQLLRETLSLRNGPSTHYPCGASEKKNEKLQQIMTLFSVLFFLVFL